MDLDNARNAKAEIFRQAFGIEPDQPEPDPQPELAETGSLGTIASIGLAWPRAIGRFGGPFAAIGRRGAGFARPRGGGRFDEPDDILDAPEAAPAAVQTEPPPASAEGALPIAIGIQRASSASDTRLVLIGENAGLREHPAVEQAIRMARGEAAFVVGGEPQALSCWTPAKRRPLALGLSVSHHLATAGTLGGFVALKDGTIALLSNNHVLANLNRAAIGDQIVQPGRIDGGSATADTVATLHQFVPLLADGAGINRVDCAIAALGPDVHPSDLFVPEAAGAISPHKGLATSDLLYAMPVWKVGRTTGLTNGKVFAVEVDNLKVNMGTPLSPFRCRFNGQIQVYTEDRGFAADGDSGALVFDHDGYAHGLLFAASMADGPTGTGFTIVNPLDEVLKQLDATLWIE